MLFFPHISLPTDIDYVPTDPFSLSSLPPMSSPPNYTTNTKNNKDNNQDKSENEFDNNTESARS